MRPSEGCKERANSSIQHFNKILANFIRKVIREVVGMQSFVLRTLRSPSETDLAIHLVRLKSLIRLTMAAAAAIRRRRQCLHKCDAQLALNVLHILRLKDLRTFEEVTK